MYKLLEYLLVYAIGGLTFPLILIATIFVHGYFFLPIHKETANLDLKDSVFYPSDDVDLIDLAKKSGDESQDCYEAEVLAGYFTVSRDYIPGGTNGRPPERITPIGSTVISAPSQSVYQSMYRSIFERKPNNNLIEKSYGKPSKKSSNVFFMVLRHGYLMFFDDNEQLEVRHVISLAHYSVSIYAGGNDIPEGELFIKRNALCLSRRRDIAGSINDGQVSKPFFLFSENCSNKEDFYFALLRNQEEQPKPLQYEIKDIITLIQKLHSSEEHLQTRWLNAITGRIFLALYKTPEVEEFFRAKIKKKISRVKKPGFLSEISLQNLNIGESSPIITNPKLKDLTINGELVVEADLRYSGNFRIEVAATARIDLGARFKPREVNLLLAVNFKKVEGHILLKIKPPPSNRFWMCFQTQPKIEMNVEPIVSSRQITYTLILRQIESRIKEVVAESLVYPNWDDSPFFGTENKSIRGGVWESNFEKGNTCSEIQESVIVKSKSSLEKSKEIKSIIEDSKILKSERENALKHPLEVGINKSVPLSSSNPAILRSSSPPISLLSNKSEISSLNSNTSSNLTEKSQNSIPSGAYPSSPIPSVSTDTTSVDAYKNSPNVEQDHENSAFSSLSQMNSSLNTTIESPFTSKFERFGDDHSFSSTYQFPEIQSNRLINMNHELISTENSQENLIGGDITESRREVFTSPAVQTSTGELKRLSLATMNNAAATAKKWGLSALHRNFDSKNDPANESKALRPLVIGRGRPLPPPGIPLPPPIRNKIPLAVPKRKLVPISERPQISEETIITLSTECIPGKNSLSPPLELKRRNPAKYKNCKEDININLLRTPVPIVQKEEGIENKQIRSTNFAGNSPTMCDLSEPFLLGSSEDNDLVIPSLVTTPEQENIRK
ncbi:hypothetical protein HI914_04246 [Erysiphe necator]|nr:hypothetical protein HI914_04246 [Erysiphe necator]